MGIKFLKLASAAAALVLSTSANAAIVSLDWQSVGDNLITRDTTSGLDWLDLTETNNMSYSDVSAQLSSGGMFEGFRYATNLEVVGLWGNFGFDLSATTRGYYGPVPEGLIQATSYLGNNMSVFSDDIDYGVGGFAGVPDEHGRVELLGVSHNTYYETVDISTLDDWYHSESLAVEHLGSYLVMETTVVPVPAAVWLFGSGLIGLAGLARRKKT